MIDAQGGYHLDLLTLVVVVSYVLIQIGITFFASRFIKTETDYLLGGRNLGIVLLSFSLFANWFGAETVVASSGAVAAEGLSGGRAEPFGYAMCLMLFGVLLAYRLRAKEYLTTSDFYHGRFGRVAEKLSVFLVIPTSLIWASAQIVAFSHVLSFLFGFDFEVGLMVGTTIVVFYSMVGGFLADVYTDFFHGLFVIVGLLITGVFVIIHVGGVDMALQKITPERLDLFNSTESFGLQMDQWTIAIVGSLVSQEAISRFLAARSPEVARRSCYVAALMYLVIGSIPVFIGLVGADIVTAPDNPDQFLPVLAKQMLPNFVYLMFLGALVSAILSTVDSTLLSVGALCGHNILIPLLKDSFTEEADKVWLQRILVMLAGFVTYLIASAGQSIYNLVEMSSSFGSAGLLVCMLFGLWTGFGSSIACVLTLIAGAAFAYIFQYVWEWDMAYIFSIVASVLVYITVAYAEKMRFVTAPAFLR